MALLNFKPFAARAVVSGTKPGTVRKERKNKIKPGDMLQLYTFIRTKKAYKLVPDRKNIDNVAITINDAGILLNGSRLTRQKRFQFAVLDGFETWIDFQRFFKDQYGGLPFNGIWHVWNEDALKYFLK